MKRTHATSNMPTLEEHSTTILERQDLSSSPSSILTAPEPEPAIPKYTVYDHIIATKSIQGSTSSGGTTNHPSVPGDGLFVSGYFESQHDGFGGDAAMDRIRSSRKKPVAAMFVHAGAGFHSHTNERYHLDACAVAAQLGMDKMNAGGSAVDAVVAAIKSLEDNTITNAGIGSNLCIDGTVECDATVVDHNGRSGAVGACSKKILLESYKVLALRRISPILLVGEGARQYALEHRVQVVDNDVMVSVNARDRWEKWSEELKKAMGAVAKPQNPLSSGMPSPTRRDHTAAILTGTFNEGQPDSPQHGAGTPTAEDPVGDAKPGRRRQISSPEHAPSRLGNSRADTGSPPTKRRRLKSPPEPMPSHQPQPRTPTRPSRNTGNQVDRSQPSRAASEEEADTRPEDQIYDTVGVIAIDYQGRIAAGSSSGGIGMKHRGRVGPAALVGIGTAVIPADEGDRTGATVAAVTSGTGEHMATSMASHKCAERLYQSTVRGVDGSDVAEDDEARILRSFIDHDFMAHPGVRNQESRPAIGIMAVKKVAAGYYFYFGHNTESFALASFASTEKQPSCVMSRIPEAATRGGPRPRTVGGARKIHV